MAMIKIFSRDPEYVVVAEFPAYVETRSVTTYREALEAAAQLINREVLRYDASFGYGSHW